MFNFFFVMLVVKVVDVFCCVNFFLQDFYGENVGKFDYVFFKYRLEVIKKRFDVKRVLGNELEDLFSEEEEEVKIKESFLEIDDWEVFLYDDD